MVSVSQNDLRFQIVQIALRDSTDGTPCPNRHKRWRVNDTMPCAHLTTPCSTISASNTKIE
jgi:hypothetical protein